MIKSQVMPSWRELFQSPYIISNYSPMFSKKSNSPSERSLSSWSMSEIGLAIGLSSFIEKKLVDYTQDPMYTRVVHSCLVDRGGSIAEMSKLFKFWASDFWLGDESKIYKVECWVTKFALQTKRFLCLTELGRRSICKILTWSACIMQMKAVQNMLCTVSLHVLFDNKTQTFFWRRESQMNTCRLLIWRSLTASGIYEFFGLWSNGSGVCTERSTTNSSQRLSAKITIIQSWCCTGNIYATSGMEILSSKPACVYIIRKLDVTEFWRRITMRSWTYCFNAWNRVGRDTDNLS